MVGSDPRTNGGWNYACPACVRSWSAGVRRVNSRPSVCRGTDRTTKQSMRWRAGRAGRDAWSVSLNEICSLLGFRPISLAPRLSPAVRPSDNKHYMHAGSLGPGHACVGSNERTDGRSFVKSGGSGNESIPRACVVHANSVHQTKIRLRGRARGRLPRKRAENPISGQTS